MKPPPFTYHRAAGVEEAVGLLADLGEDAKVLAGGQSLVPMLNFRLARPAALIDVTRIPGLSYITDDGTTLRIGALTRHRHVEHYPGDLGGLNVLPDAARWVGHYPIRAQGTFGGSIAHADPAAEWCVLARLLDAQIVARGPGGSRTIPAERFFSGFLTTALDPDEMVVEVRFPHRPTHAALEEFARRHGDFMVVGAAVAWNLDADGRCRDPRVALGGVASAPLRVAAAERVLEGETPGPRVWEAAGRAAAAGIDPPADMHASADYRRDLAAAMIERAAARAARP